jgi:hypothetical protein
MAFQPAKPAALGTKQWEFLRGSDVSDVCRRAKVTWNPDGFYTVPFLDKTFRVFPASEQVETDSGDPAAGNPEFRLVLLCYLLLTKDIPSMAHWVSEKDLPGGSMFFTGPHALPSMPLIKQFGNAPEKFLEAGKKIGGIELPSYGDAALVFTVLPRIQCACVVWKKDDEFPARASFLFDQTADAHLTLDILTAMVRYLVKCIVQAAIL